MQEPKEPKEESIFSRIVKDYMEKGYTRANAESLAREFVMYMDKT